MTNLLYSLYITIEPIINKLSYNTGIPLFAVEKLTKINLVIQERLDGVTILSSEVGSVDITMMELMNLQMGDVIKLENTQPKQT